MLVPMERFRLSILGLLWEFRCIGRGVLELILSPLAWATSGTGYLLSLHRGAEMLGLGVVTAGAGASWWVSHWLDDSYPFVAFILWGVPMFLAPFILIGWSMVFQMRRYHREHLDEQRERAKLN